MVCFYKETAHYGPTKLPLSFSRLVSQCITFEPTETRISFPIKQRSGCFQNISHRIRQEHLTRGLQCRSSPIGKTRCLPIFSADLLTADDVARLSVEVEGWSVIVEASGVFVGHVEEVLQLASVSDSADDDDYDDVIEDHENTCNDDDVDISSNEDSEASQVSKTSVDHGSESGSDKWRAIERFPVRDSNRIEEYMLRISGEKMMGRRLEFLVPLVPAIVTAVDRKKRRLFINLGPAISRQKWVPFMPTRRQLIAAGKADLVEDIMSLGGFLAVAQVLGLKARRRPTGFWEDLTCLDVELEWFVASSWVAEEDKTTGAVLFCNKVTNAVMDSIPPTAPGVMSPHVAAQGVEVDEDATAVMPRQRHLIKAGRYDLHHAILLHGGYREVGRQLGRHPPPREPMGALRVALRAFVAQHRLTTLPSMKALRAAGRGDLALAVRRGGGSSAVADYMGLRPSRQKVGHWGDIHVAAQHVKQYLVERVSREGGGGGGGGGVGGGTDFDFEDVWREAKAEGKVAMPSWGELEVEKRYDIKHIMQKYGSEVLAKELGVPHARRGRREK